jgi:hypothetical protein
LKPITVSGCVGPAVGGLDCVTVGKENLKMAIQRRDLIFRVFVSSTFSDLVNERNALQENVHPELREYCRQRGARFQAIDLRWGVSQEAALDQQTMNICLQELRRCQDVSPKPNFVVLLGNRYGWRPPPPQIDADEFEALLNELSESERQKLKTWYRRDENAKPPEYALLPREVEYPEGATEEQRKAARHEEAQSWATTEAELRAILLQAVDRIRPERDPDEPDYDQQWWKYDESATHQEIRHGAKKTENPREHVFCYFREIEGLPADATVARYRDIRDGLPDTDAEGRLIALKAELRTLLSDSNVRSYDARWENGLPVFDLDKLCEDVKRDLKGVIDEELRRFQQRSALGREREAHREFAEQRSRHFVGRAKLLKRIRSYVESPAGGEPLLVHGTSGSGKTALLAKAWLDAADKTGVAARFIGATPGSSDLRSLLIDLCRELGIENPPQEMNELVSAFRDRLSSPDQSSLGEADREAEAVAPAGDAILFLDALDQLNPTDNARLLYWLPRKLRPGVKLVMSVLELKSEEEHASARDDPFDLASRIWPNSLEKVGPLGEDDGKNLLEAWLAEARRDLQDDQKEHVLSKFSAGGNPLYLKLAFEEAKRWKSWEGLPRRSADVHGLNEDVPGILDDLFWRLELPENHGRMLVQYAIRYIAAGRNGLTEDELIDLLSIKKEVMEDFFRRSPESPRVDRLPVVIWSRLFSDLRPYMTHRRADGTVVLDFYHRQVRESVRTRYLASEETLTKAHLHLAEYFDSLDYWAESLESQRARARRLPPTPRPANVRKVVELPYHRLEVAKLAGKDDPKSPHWDAVADLLTNWQFLEAKAEADPNFQEQDSVEPF